MITGSDFSGFSDELLAMLGGLTARQRAAIPQIVATLAEGGALSRLIRGGPRRKDRPGSGEGICAWHTYYGRKGWSHNPQFVAALERARKEYDAALLRDAVDEAAERLRRAAPASARAAEAIVQALLRGSDEAGIPSPLETLLKITQDGGAGRGQVQAASALLGKGLQAALSILDRADIETAVKSAGGAEAEWRGLLEELRGGGDEDADEEARSESD